MMEFWVGTSGYSYKEWKGRFYPAKLPDEEMLRAYADRLPAGEINNTFYRLPQAAVLESSAQQAPGGFRFVLQACRRPPPSGRGAVRVSPRGGRLGADAAQGVGAHRAALRLSDTDREPIDALVSTA